MAAMHDEFFWGSPYSEFGATLMLTIFHHYSRSQEVVDQRRTFNLLIPSWSWFGWKSIVHLPAFRAYTKSLLAVYRWQDNQRVSISRTNISTLSKEEGHGLIFGVDTREQNIWHNKVDWSVGMDNIPHNVTLNNNQLIFWTFVISCPISEIGEYALMGRDNRNEPQGNATSLALRIIWSDNIARRVAYKRVLVSDRFAGRAVKKLIVLE